MARRFDICTRLAPIVSLRTAPKPKRAATLIHEPEISVLCCCSLHLQCNESVGFARVGINFDQISIVLGKLRLLELLQQSNSLGGFAARPLIMMEKLETRPTIETHETCKSGEHPTSELGWCLEFKLWTLESRL